MQGQGGRGLAVHARGVPGTSANLKPEAYDLAGAKKLLAEAGYPNGFGLTVASTNDRYINDAAMTQAVAQMWSRLGLKITVSTLPKAVYFPRAVKLEFSVSAERQFHRHQRAVVAIDIICWARSTRARGSAPGNYGRYSNPALDKMLGGGGGDAG